VIRLAQSLKAWGTPHFEAILKHEIAQVDADLLPLQQALSTTSHVTGSPRTVRIIRVVDGGGTIRVKAGIFYSGIIAGCSCADDPTPIDEHNEYCEVELAIDTNTAETVVTLVQE